jgi:hypothetical protein
MASTQYGGSVKYGPDEHEAIRQEGNKRYSYTMFVIERKDLDDGGRLWLDPHTLSLWRVVTEEETTRHEEANRRFYERNPRVRVFQVSVKELAGSTVETY